MAVTGQGQKEMAMLVEEELLSRAEAQELGLRLSSSGSAFDLLEKEGAFSSLVLDDLRERGVVVSGMGCSPRPLRLILGAFLYSAADKG